MSSTGGTTSAEGGNSLLLDMPLRLRQISSSSATWSSSVGAWFPWRASIHAFFITSAWPASFSSRWALIAASFFLARWLFVWKTGANLLVILENLLDLLFTSELFPVGETSCASRGGISGIEPFLPVGKSRTPPDHVMADSWFSSWGWTSSWPTLVEALADPCHCDIKKQSNVGELERVHIFATGRYVC